MNYTTPTRTVSALPPGTAFARYAKALGLSKGDVAAAAEYASTFRDSPQVAAALEDRHRKTLVSAQTVTALMRHLRRSASRVA